MSGNFEFVRNYDGELYDSIVYGEKNLKIDYVASGKALREAFENFINSICDTYPEIISELNSRKTTKLYEKILFLTNIKELASVKSRFGGLQIEPVSYDELFKCRCDNVICKRAFQSEEKRSRAKFVIKNEADFIRIACNDFTHPEEKEHTFRRTYETIRDAYRYFQRILGNYYCKTSGFTPFDENRIPIGDYAVESSSIPDDRDMTNCRREYLCTYRESGSLELLGETWAIIREYRRENMDENFISRDRDVQVLAAISGISTGIQAVALTKPDDRNTPFYIIAYKFPRKPHPLTDVFGDLTQENKYEIAIQVADYFRQLHGSGIPIYHRMFNYKCVYLYDVEDVLGKGGWKLAVTKFDFSKISDKRMATVISSASSAVGMLADSESKYIAPEWATNPERSNWEKVDIYSLGVFFADLFSGKILGSLDEFFENELTEDNVNDTIQLLIDEMTSDDSQIRPTAQSVYKTLEECRGL